MSVLRAIVRAVPVVTAGLGGALVFAVGYILIAGSTGRSPDKEPWIVDSVLGYLTIASVGAAVGYLAFRAWKGGSEQGGLAKFLLTVVFSALSGIGAVGTAVVLIFKFASIWDRPRNAKPESAQDAQLAIVILLLVLVIVATVLVVAWARRIEHAGVIGAVVGVFLFDAALIWGVPALVGRGGDVHDPPRGPAAARYLEGFRLRHEVMLVIDPGEPGGRRLIRQLKDEPGTLTQERDGIARWNVATGVAVPAANGGSMSIEQKPTTSRRDLLAAIRDIPLARRPASLGQHRSSPAARTETGCLALRLPASIRPCRR